MTFRVQVIYNIKADTNEEVIQLAKDLYDPTLSEPDDEYNPDFMEAARDIVSHLEVGNGTDIAYEVSTYIEDIGTHQDMF